MFQALLLGPLTLGLLAWVQDWYVDVNAAGCPTGTGTQADPFCDIMDAVAAAADGDTIHVAPGTYFENVVLDKDLTLIGTGGEQVTILDGMASGSVVRVGAADVALTGLTLTNGTGTPTSFGSGVAISGGGLFAGDGDYYNDLPRVTLTSCTVTGNLCMASGSFAYAFGGGIGAGGAVQVTLANTTVNSNSCEASGTYAITYGGGVYASRLTMTESTVSGNLCDSSGLYGSWAHGGGINTGSLTATDSMVRGNKSHSTGSELGGGIRAGIAVLQRVVVNDNSAALGGGIASTQAQITDSKVSENEAVAGGGLYQLFSYGVVTLQSSTLTGNVALSGAGGGIHSSGYLTLLNCSVSGNTGDGLYNAGYLTLLNSSVASNSGYGVAKVHSAYVYDVELTVGNSILWSNGSGALVLGAGALAEVGHSLIEGGWPGTGNINADPLFVDALNGDFRLMPGSPCIDAGDNLVVPTNIWTDLAGKRRFIDGTGAGLGPRKWPFVDMGAYEFGNDPPSKVRQR